MRASKSYEVKDIRPSGVPTLRVVDEPAIARGDFVFFWYRKVGQRKIEREGRQPKAPEKTRRVLVFA